MVVHYFKNIVHVFMIFFKEMILHPVYGHIFIYMYLWKRVIFVIPRVAMSGKIIQDLN